LAKLEKQLMSISNGYATLTEYKAYISMRGLAGATGTDASDDAVIEDLIEAVSRFADRTTGRRFYADASDAAYYYDPKDSRIIEDLPDFKSITTVSVDYQGQRSYTDLAGSDWEALPLNYSAEGKPIRGIAILPSATAYLPTYRAGVKITGKRGFPAVPDDIKEAVIETVSNIYAARSGQTSQGRISVTASGVVIRPDDVPDFAMAIFQSYRFLT
jgi:hypothetical protein